MPTEQQVYDEFAEQYDRLVEREDYQNNIIGAIENICPLEGLDVVDLGAGTGRLMRLLVSRAGSIKAYDSSAHMLARAEAALQLAGLANWQVGVADHRDVPVLNASADRVILPECTGIWWQKV